MPTEPQKPHVGARVSTRHRMIAEIKREDTGTITRLEDGGYCVVKWDSDGESTSVLMVSLRPLGNPQTEPDLLDEKAIAEIERALTDSPCATFPMTTEEVRALCQTVRAARAKLDFEYRDPAGLNSLLNSSYKQRDGLQTEITALREQLGQVERQRDGYKRLTDSAEKQNEELLAQLAQVEKERSVNLCGDVTHCATCAEAKDFKP